MPIIRSLFATLFASTNITGRLIRSLFATLNVDTYNYALPKKPTFVELKARQSLSSSLLGRTVTSLFWSQEDLYEALVDNFGKVEFGLPHFLRYAPIELSQPINIYEVVNLDPVLGATTLSKNALLRNDIIYVFNSSLINIDDYIRIGDLTSDYFISKVKSINGSEIELTSPFGKNIVMGEEVKTVDVVSLINGTDYTLDEISGELTLLPNSVTLGNKLLAEYVPNFDVDQFAIYLIEGDNVVPISEGFSDLDYDTIKTHPLSIEIDDNIASENNAYADALNVGQNGKTFTYYLFSKDSQGGTSYAQTIVFESIPSVPQGIMAKIDDQAVILEWDLLPASSDDNTDGFNVYRCDGEIFVHSSALMVNSTLIPYSNATFIDSSLNVTNRDSSVDFPVNSQYYTYKVESEDTLTSWIVGTQNEIGNIEKNEFARK